MAKRFLTLKQIRAEQTLFEQIHLQDALNAHGWNQRQTAKALGCPPTTLRRLIAKHPRLKRLANRRSVGVGRPFTD